jgi:hypothetical protein
VLLLRRSSWLVTALGALGALGAVGVGCTGAGPEVALDADVASRSEGIVFVERVSDGSGARVHVGGRFFRSQGVRTESLPELVGAPPSAAGVGCTERAAMGDGPDATQAEVQLLDVGAIDARADALAARMAPHRLPDLWNVVSGVVYGLDGELPSGAWQFTGAGDPVTQRGAFDVSGAPPEPIADLRLGDDPLPLANGAAASLPRRGGLSLRWARGSSADRIAVVFEGAGTMSCGARDDGAFDLDGPQVERVRELLRQGGTVSVHRLRVIPFAMGGIDRASLVFDQVVRVRAE